MISRQQFIETIIRLEETRDLLTRLEDGENNRPTVRKTAIRLFLLKQDFEAAKNRYPDSFSGAFTFFNADIIPTDYGIDIVNNGKTYPLKALEHGELYEYKFILCPHCGHELSFLHNLYDLENRVRKVGELYKCNTECSYKGYFHTDVNGRLHQGDPYQN